MPHEQILSSIEKRASHLFLPDARVLQTLELLDGRMDG